MCTVHRVIPVGSNEKYIVSYDPNGKRVLSNSELWWEVSHAMFSTSPGNTKEMTTAGTITFDEKPAKTTRRESRFEHARRQENQRFIGAAPLPPAPEDHRLSPQFGDSKSRIKTAANSDQLSDREQRNKRTKTLGRYVHVTPASTYMWNGVLCTSEETHETRKIVKTFWCDSHGKHGRKPRYKDFLSPHARI